MKENYVIYDERSDVEIIVSMTKEQVETINAFLVLMELHCEYSVDKANEYMAKELVSND
jgi:hypothetical protein